MEEFKLNDTINKLYKITNQIINIYNQILTTILNQENIESLLEELKETIQEEDKIIAAIPKEEIVRCINIVLEMEEEVARPCLEKEDMEEENWDEYLDDSQFDIDSDFDSDEDNDCCDEDYLDDYSTLDIDIDYSTLPLILQRMSSKLSAASEVNNNNYFFTDNLFPSPRKKISILDVISSLILIETIQGLRQFIDYSAPYPYELSPTHYDNDINFLKALDIEFKDYIIRTLILSTTIETIFIEKGDIYTIPKANIEQTKNTISTKFGANYEVIIRTTAREVINILSTIINIENTPYNVLKYMELLTKLDILLTYTDKTLFTTLEEDLNKTIFQNESIKKRVKNIFNSHKGKGRAKQPNKD